MADSLLERELTHYDPLFFGCTPEGLAFGVDLMCGLGGWVGPDGLIALFRGSSRDAIDRDNPIGAAAHDANSITPFSYVEHQADTTYFYECVAVGGGGVTACPNVADPQIVRVRTDGGGDPVDPRPAAPRDLRAAAIAGGKFRLAWSYVPGSNGVRVAKFNVYSNGGAGDVDYQTPVATVNARLSGLGAGIYGWESGAFDHGTYVKWAVRAADADDNEEANTKIITVQADAEGPAPHTIASAAYGEDE